jgi:hypothetical protein
LGLPRFLLPDGRHSNTIFGRLSRVCQWQFHSRSRKTQPSVVTTPLSGYDENPK